MQRKSFASIEIKIHPNINDYVFDFKSTSLDSKENEQIVEEMMGVFFESIPKENDGTGEWEWLQKRKQNNFIDKVTKKKINNETIKLLELQKDSMVKFLMKIPKLYYTKSHFPLEISQRAFDHLWRVCESYEMWCKETKQEKLITLNILD